MPELLDTGSSGSGWSYWSLLLLCEQKWAFRYEANIAKLRGEHFETVEEDPEDLALPLRKGSVMHAGLGHFYALMQGRDVYAPTEAMSIVGDKLKVDAKTMDELRRIYRAYEDKYQYDTWEVLEVEKLYICNIDGVIYTMRKDLVIRDRGVVYTVDHKTSSRIGPEMRSRYTLSGQFVAARQIGQKLWPNEYRGVMINGVTSVMRGGTAFLRIPLAPIPGTKWEHFKATIKDAARRRDEIVEGRKPLRVLHENVCMTQYGPCPYFARCQGLR